ncbi:hypothetical protein Tco_1155865 [Tanacetum coccineum]
MTGKVVENRWTLPGDQGDDRIDGQGGKVGGQCSESIEGKLRCYSVYTVIVENMGIHFQDMSRCMSCEDFKTLTREELCPSNEMQKLETELWNHAMVGAGYAAYADRFNSER